MENNNTKLLYFESIPNLDNCFTASLVVLKISPEKHESLNSNLFSKNKNRSCKQFKNLVIVTMD